jgi:thymidine kinase
VLVDEVQFLTPEQIELLSDVVDFYNVPVICYGLRTDFQSRLFPGSRRLFELADVIEEIPTVCWCGHRAHFNARVIGGKIVLTGEQVFLGGNESYVPLCRKHYKARDLGPSA